MTAGSPGPGRPQGFLSLSLSPPHQLHREGLQTHHHETRNSEGDNMASSSGYSFSFSLNALNQKRPHCCTQTPSLSPQAGRTATLKQTAGGDEGSLPSSGAGRATLLRRRAQAPQAPLPCTKHFLWPQAQCSPLPSFPDCFSPTGGTRASAICLSPGLGAGSEQGCGPVKGKRRTSIQLLTDQPSKVTSPSLGLSFLIC